MTISDGCDGILYISADSKNIVTIDTIVTGNERRCGNDNREIGI